MSREIKFRGKSIDSRYSTEEYFLEMVYGQLIYRYGDFYILMSNGVEVKIDGETVGQYIGTTDKNDKRIYEGDIVKIDGFDDEEDERFSVKFENESARYILSGNRLVYDFDNIFRNEIEVLGNIHDNPKLLEGEE